MSNILINKLYNINCNIVNVSIMNNNLYIEIKIFSKIGFNKTINYFIYNKNIW